MLFISAFKFIRQFRLLNSHFSHHADLTSVLNCKIQSTFLSQKLYSSKNSTIVGKTMNLSSVIRIFEEIAPKYLAEKWDNTGLLIEPKEDSLITTILLTNDLTEDVLKEAIIRKANLIISYHPPIFSGFKALCSRNWKDRIVMKCITNEIAVYSPHTSCDAIRDGVNDWLIKCFDLTASKPIKPIDTQRCVLECYVPKHLELNKVLNSELDFEILMTSDYGIDSKLVKISMNSKSACTIHQILSANRDFRLISFTDCKSINSLPLDGMGRIGQLRKPMKLGDCIEVMKDHVKLQYLRVAIGINCSLDTEISVIACCAGSGASLLRNVPADLFITGEMSHHDLLDAQHSKTSVILCEHSNSERGYLKCLASNFGSKLQGVNVVVSSIDKDPITIL